MVKKSMLQRKGIRFSLPRRAKGRDGVPLAYSLVRHEKTRANQHDRMKAICSFCFLLDFVQASQNRFKSSRLCFCTFFRFDALKSNAHWEPACYKEHKETQDFVLPTTDSKKGRFFVLFGLFRRRFSPNTPQRVSRHNVENRLTQRGVSANMARCVARCPLLWHQIRHVLRHFTAFGELTFRQESRQIRSKVTDWLVAFAARQNCRPSPSATSF